ncbi:MAG: hydantoinase/oxoprolinase family protein [Solirubrobacterales bacterium]|nr:hydantoinase/oxoprolinase family protein [Solirubrobacterales bacterium]
MRYRVGVDVGGTFTDLLVTHGSGEARLYKSPTTPADPSIGVLEGLERAARDQGRALDEFLADVGTIVHGTTITTNAVLTGDGARTGFVTTNGFRDVLNMRRGLKARQFEKYAPPVPLVPRHRIQVVEERVTVDGSVMTPLREHDVREAARLFREQDVEAVAVSCLWSFRNPQHEERIGEILAEELPEAYVSLSTEVLPQIRVYERHSTTALNAYVGPVLRRYLVRLEEELSGQRFGGTLLIMQSNGGVMSPQLAQRFASNTLLSGPAAGPVAGVFYAATHGLQNAITIDMGGTSFDVSLVAGGTPAVTIEGEIGGHRVASPVVDIHTIGAGGGSIAWIDSGGLLAVGPKSAGADPGPACYGRGGTEPTVTDADLLLGYLDADFFHGGELRLDIDAARNAIGALCEPLGMDATEAAAGIYRVVNANMAAALGVVSVQRGYDPREFVLVVAGGAGPIHAAQIARELEIPLILIPRQSSVYCAVGMLISDLQHDYVRTYARDLDQVDLAEVGGLYRDMAADARATLVGEGMDDDRIELRFSADLRYVGQFNEVEVPALNGTGDTEPRLGDMVAAFNERHDTLYGYSMPGAPVELINLRVSARGVTDKPGFSRGEPGEADPSAARKSSRRAYFDGEFVEVPVYDGLRLLAGNVVSGPAIVEQPTTTIVVPADAELDCDEHNNYLIHPEGTTVQELRELLAKES